MWLFDFVPISQNTTMQILSKNPIVLLKEYRWARKTLDIIASSMFIRVMLIEHIINVTEQVEIDHRPINQ